VIGEVAERLAAEGAEVNSTDGVAGQDRRRLVAAARLEHPGRAGRRAEAKDQAGLDRLMATVNDQLEKSGIAAVEAAH
jgi:phosphomannomutase